MIRNMRGTIAATSADAASVPPGQRQNSPARNGGLRNRERSGKAATQVATPMHGTGQMPTTLNATALVSRSIGRPQTGSTPTEPVS
jgi:hypothetical protein